MNEMSDVTTLYLGLFIYFIIYLTNSPVSQLHMALKCTAIGEKWIERDVAGIDRGCILEGKFWSFTGGTDVSVRLRDSYVQDLNPGPTEYKQILCNQIWRIRGYMRGCNT